MTPAELEAILARAYADPENAAAILDAAGVVYDRSGLALACQSFAKKRAAKGRHEHH